MMVAGFVTPAPWAKALRRVVTVGDVIDAACKSLRVTPAAMVGPSRSALLVRARHAAMYCARKMCGASFPEVGRAFGKRDSTTAIHACAKVQGAIDAGDERTIAEVEAVMREVAAS